MSQWVHSDVAVLQIIYLEINKCTISCLTENFCNPGQLRPYSSLLGKFIDMRYNAESIVYLYSLLSVLLCSLLFGFSLFNKIKIGLRARSLVNLFNKPTITFIPDMELPVAMSLPAKD